MFINCFCWNSGLYFFLFWIKWFFFFFFCYFILFLFLFSNLSKVIPKEKGRDGIDSLSSYLICTLFKIIWTLSTILLIKDVVNESPPVFALFKDFLKFSNSSSFCCFIYLFIFFFFKKMISLFAFCFLSVNEPFVIFVLLVFDHILHLNLGQPINKHHSIQKLQVYSWDFAKEQLMIMIQQFLIYLFIYLFIMTN